MAADDEIGGAVEDAIRSHGNTDEAHARSVPDRLHRATVQQVHVP
jgi:hypothetical protein